MTAHNATNLPSRTEPVFSAECPSISCGRFALFLGNSAQDRAKSMSGQEERQRKSAIDPARTSSAGKVDDGKDSVTGRLRVFATNSNPSELRSSLRDFLSRLRAKLDRIYDIPRS